MRGMIVESSPTLALLLGQAFRTLGFEVPIIVSDFPHALHRLNGVSFIVTDGNASHYRALLLARRLRDTPETATLPLIMITAHRSSVELLETMAAGVNCCLVKPFTQEMLRQQILESLAAPPRHSVAPRRAFLPPSATGIIKTA